MWLVTSPPKQGGDRFAAKSDPRFFRVTQTCGVQVTFSGVKWPPFGWSKGHLEEAGPVFLEISEVGRYLGDKYDQIQPGFYEK